MSILQLLHLRLISNIRLFDRWKYQLQVRDESVHSLKEEHCRAMVHSVIGARMAVEKDHVVRLLLVKETHRLSLACDYGTDISAVFVLQVVADSQRGVGITEVQVYHSILCKRAFHLFINKAKTTI